MPLSLSYTRAISLSESSSSSSSCSSPPNVCGNGTVLFDHQHRHVGCPITHTSFHLTICFCQSCDSATLSDGGMR